jgi:hypothetical protein
VNVRLQNSIHVFSLLLEQQLTQYIRTSERQWGGDLDLRIYLEFLREVRQDRDSDRKLGPFGGKSHVSIF